MPPGAQSEDYLRSRAEQHLATQRQLESDIWKLETVRDALLEHPIFGAGTMIAPEVWQSPRGDAARTDWNSTVSILESLIVELDARIGQYQRDAANAGLAAQNATRAADVAAQSEAAAAAAVAPATPPASGTTTTRPASTTSGLGPR